MSRLNEASSFHLRGGGAHVRARDAGGPASRYGHTEAAADGALPAFFFRVRSFQPMALAPSWMAWGRPHERMICL